MTGPPERKRPPPGNGGRDQGRGSQRSRAKCRAAKGRRNPNLSPDEQTVLAALTEAAKDGRRCPTTDELLELMPHRASASGVIELLDRLEAKGHIGIRRFQRSRQVYIHSIGKWTAAPGDMTPHWRGRDPGAKIPAPSITAISERYPDEAREVLAEASRLGRAPADFLCELVRAGWVFHKSGQAA